MPADAAAAFVITERSGERRVIRLLGRALPYRPFGLKTVQRMEVTHYPGLPDGTATMAGADDGGSTLRGMWKDMYLGAPEQVAGQQTAPLSVDGAAILTAEDAVNLFEDLTRSGVEVDVTWAHVARRGQLKEFSPEWYNVHDVGWTMQFEWTSRGDDAGPASFAAEGSLSDASASLVAGRDAVAAGIPADFPLPRDLATGLTADLADITAMVASVQGASDVLGGRATSPQGSARQAIAACGALAARCDALAARVSAMPPQAVLGASPTAAPTLGQVVAAEAWQRGLLAATRRLRRDAATRQAAFARSVASALLALYTAREDDNLRDVARQFYGDATQWRTLLLYNALTDAALVAGQVVLVPRLSDEGA